MTTFFTNLVGAGQSAMLRLRAQLQPRNLLDNAAISAFLGTVLLRACQLPFSRERKLALMTAATRRLNSRPLLASGRKVLQPWLQPQQVDIWRDKKIGWHRYYQAFGNIARDRALTTSLILKEPGENGEKGVLYCSFEFNWMKLVANHDAKALFRDYLLVGASSWSPSDHAVLANLCGLSEDPHFIGISNQSDIDQYQLFAPHIYPLPVLACDWVEANDYKPLPHSSRSIDILMVSHFAAWKRHWLLFEALRDMRPELNVTLIGRNAPGRTEKEIRAEARAFGVRQQLTILKNLEIDDVMRHQCDAKVAVALSKREGSCVSVTESMFANTPVAMMNDAHIGARAYINTHTGGILARHNMSRVLTDMIERSGNYKPRAWAVENISARLTSTKLNRILQQYCVGKGMPWTRDIAPLCWRYVPRYLEASDRTRLRPALERLRAQHGITLDEFISEEHASRKKSTIIQEPPRAGQAEKGRATR